MSDIDVSQLMEIINSKADRDLNNLNLNAGIDTIKEYYSDGANWCRVWESGWCEQGGIEYHSTDTKSSMNGINITFLKEFKDTNYVFLRLANNNSSTSGTDTYALNYNTKYTGYITVGKESNSTESNWYACGFVN